jgi:hypothetical protein
MAREIIAASTTAVPAPKRRAAPRRNAKTEETAVAVVTIAAEAGASVSPRAQSRKKVYQMADSGVAPAAIARTTGLSEGEVETLIGLRQARG